MRSIGQMVQKLSFGQTHRQTDTSETITFPLLQVVINKKSHKCNFLQNTGATFRTKQIKIHICVTVFRIFWLHSKFNNNALQSKANRLLV